MNQTNKLIQKHFEKKPGERMEVLRERFESISSFHKDPLSAALLATSYYGMEELNMRLPRLNDILRNPFSQEEILHAITGLIMIADGGPAEGAKAIQIYMALQRKGLQTLDAKTSHMITLLAICCKQVNPLMEEIFRADGNAHISYNNTHITDSNVHTADSNVHTADMHINTLDINNHDYAYDKAIFCQAAEKWLYEEAKRQEELADETNIAYSLLVGMKEEVETILDEEL